MVATISAASTAPASTSIGRAGISTPSAFVPTQGGFEESTNLSMPKVQVGSDVVHAQEHATPTGRRSATCIAIAAAKPPWSTTRSRSIGRSTSRSRPSAVRTRAWRRRARGELDLRRVGRRRKPATGTAARIAPPAWRSKPAIAGRSAPYRPWLRAGYLWASGDRDQEDDRHGTFFQMLPSSRKYALSSVYAQMNLSDAFAQLLVEPRRFKARIEVHALQLASGADLWYQGSGATASKGRFFGFSGRAAGGAPPLGTVVEGAVDVPIRKYWSVNAYAGTMSAGDVVTQMFTSKRLDVLVASKTSIRF